MENIIEPEVLREVVVDIDETHKVVQQFDKDGNMVRELWMGVVAPEPEADPREDFRSFLVDAHGNPLKEGQEHLSTHRVFRYCYDGKLISESIYPLAD